MLGRGPAARRWDQRGSALILAPAAVLVAVALASIAIDSAAVCLGQRQLAETAASAATDATAAVSAAEFYTSGRVVLDPARATAIADASVASQRLHGVHLLPPVEVLVAGRQVCVALTGEVRTIVGRAFPFVPRWTVVRARATATAAGGRQSSVPHRRIC
jgi:hypothetical protein